jgi:subtilisin family serine protease
VGLAPQAIETALGKLDGFSFVEPNGILRAAATPNDTDFGQQYGLNNTGQSGGTSDADIDAPEAWDLSTGHTGTVVAVLDTGVDYNHTDLAGNKWVNPNEIAGNGIDDDGNGDVDDVLGLDVVNSDYDPLDDAGHGTKVAGVIAAVGNNSSGVAGVAWSAKILPVKVLNSVGAGTFANAAIGLNYINLLADVGVNVRVVNASLGGPSGSATLQTRIQDAANRGIVFVTAAGNNGFNDGTHPGGWDNDDSGGTQAVYPSSYSDANIISVAASTRNDTRATFSNWGATSVDLFAPGQDIITTQMGGGTVTDSGTSFAAPMVAGTAALIFSIKPDATVAEVKDAILDNVDTKAAFSGLVATGGRLNAFNAVESVSLSQGFAKIVLGDYQGAKRADDFYIQPNPSNSSQTQIMRFVSGSYVVQATVTNASNKKIAIYGLGGNDVFGVAAGVSNPLYFQGGSGDDTLNGNTTNDTLIGEAGNDSIQGGSGNDSIIGSGGNDILIGNAGNDSMFGEGGGDLFYALDSTIDTLVGGSGTDSIGNSDGSDVISEIP